MRPEKLNYEMNKAFQHWFRTNSMEKFLPLLRELKRVWNKLSKNENDYRSGEETYGYSSPDQIENTMCYISDRWKVSFRMKWLIDGIEQNKI